MQNYATKACTSIWPILQTSQSPYAAYIINNTFYSKSVKVSNYFQLATIPLMVHRSQVSGNTSAAMVAIQHNS